MGFIIIGDEAVDVRGIHDIVSKAQVDTIGFMVRYLEVSNNDEKIDIKRKIDELYSAISKEGVDFVYSSYFTTGKRFLDLPRKQEVMAFINRMRHLDFKK